MDSDRIELDGEERKLVLKGSCLELIPLCSAACCREWGIKLSFEEYISGLYAAEQTCLLTYKTCNEKPMTCINQIYQLRKNADGACFHLDEDNKCSIYQNRPQVCRDFTCQGGWRLASVFPVAEDSTLSDYRQKNYRPEKDTFIERLTDDMTFVSHPLIKLDAVSYLKAKGEITFLKELVGTCGEFHTKDNFQFPQLDDDLLVRLTHLFDNKQPLKEILQSFRDQYTESLTKKEFYEIVWLLNKHNIIIEARSFSGMLSNIYGI